MFCKHCGAQINDDASFCDKCGQSIQSADTNPKRGLSNKKIMLAVGIIVVLLLVIIAVPKLSGGSEPAAGNPSVRSEPIVGKWTSPVAINGDIVIPLTEIWSDGYIDIKGSGTYSMCLDGETKVNGTWERYDDEIESDSLVYLLRIEGESGNQLLTYDQEDESLMVLVNDIAIVFQK